MNLFQTFFFGIGVGYVTTETIALVRRLRSGKKWWEE